MLSSKMSQPVKTRSSSPARGTNSLILGDRPSVRLPSRTVPIWVSDPIGFARSLRIASTPATKVVATAPMPGIITPSFPFADWMVPPPLGSVRAWRSAFISTRAVFALNAEFADVLLAAFADFFLVAIMVGCFLIRTKIGLQTVYVLVPGGFCKRERSNAQKVVSTVVHEYWTGRLDQPPATAVTLAR